MSSRVVTGFVADLPAVVVVVAVAVAVVVVVVVVVFVAVAVVAVNPFCTAAVVTIVSLLVSPELLSIVKAGTVTFSLETTESEVEEVLSALPWAVVTCVTIVVVIVLAVSLIGSCRTLTVIDTVSSVSLLSVGSSGTVFCKTVVVVVTVVTMLVCRTLTVVMVVESLPTASELSSNGNTGTVEVCLAAEEVPLVVTWIGGVDAVSVVSAKGNCGTVAVIDSVSSVPALSVGSSGTVFCNTVVDVVTVVTMLVCRTLTVVVVVISLPDTSELSSNDNPGTVEVCLVAEEVPLVVTWIDGVDAASVVSSKGIGGIVDPANVAVESGAVKVTPLLSLSLKLATGVRETASADVISIARDVVTSMTSSLGLVTS